MNHFSEAFIHLEVRFTDEKLGPEWYIMKTILNWFLKKFYWPLLAIPVALILGVYQLSESNFRGWDNSQVLRADMEIIHPVALLCFTLVAFQSWQLTRAYVYGWLAIMGAAVVMREIHFEGSDIIVYTTLIVLWGLAWKRPEKLSELWNNRLALSLLVMCFTSWILSESFDRGIIKNIIQLAIGDQEWDLKHATNIEESMECLGGTFLLFSVLCLPPKRTPKTSS